MLKAHSLDFAATALKHLEEVSKLKVSSANLSTAKSFGASDLIFSESINLQLPSAYKERTDSRPQFIHWGDVNKIKEEDASLADFDAFLSSSSSEKTWELYNEILRQRSFYKGSFSLNQFLKSKINAYCSLKRIKSHKDYFHMESLVLLEAQKRGLLLKPLKALFRASTLSLMKRSSRGVLVDQSFDLRVAFEGSHFFLALPFLSKGYSREDFWSLLCDVLLRNSKSASQALFPELLLLKQIGADIHFISGSCRTWSDCDPVTLVLHLDCAETSKKFRNLSLTHVFPLTDQELELISEEDDFDEQVA